MLSGVVHRKRQAVPIQKKALLTIEEAAEYTGIGLHKLRELSNRKSCTFILWNGNKRMFKQKKLVEYLEEAYSI
ncbi:MAG: helix-turn-helix domain-containing protein [Lachnospiraceae bacterium]|nr:helix-turn-helix domain-containing protein [Lachnospiraceae bacterium]